MKSDEFPKRALIISSMASMIDNFNRYNIKIIENLGYKITLAASFGNEDSNSAEKNKRFYQEMIEKGYDVVPIQFSRSITNIPLQVKSIKQVKKLLKNNYDIVHCHSPICSVITRLLYKGYRKKYGGKIIYTAHGFHFYDGAPLKNWLIYYPVEKLCSRWTDILITINKEDYKRASQKFNAKKTVYVPGVGVDTKKFGVKFNGDKVREELGIAKDQTILLSVGELSVRKNHKVIIEALSKIDNPDIYYFIVGKGKLQNELQKMIEETGLSDHVKLLGYRSDITNLLAASDLFVFPSLQEGLPVSLMEAMASGLPVACSRIRGNTDLIEDENGGVLFDPHSVEDCRNAIEKLLSADWKKLGSYNLEKIKKFSIETVNEQMIEIFKGMN